VRGEMDETEPSLEDMVKGEDCEVMDEK
jgi:hypothetical protein